MYPAQTILPSFPLGGKDGLFKIQSIPRKVSRHHSRHLCMQINMHNEERGLGTVRCVCVQRQKQWILE